MIANKYKILFSDTTNQQQINLPIEIKWDFLDRNDSLVEYEKKTIKEVINQDKDFEVVRFSHAQEPITFATDINYNFWFTPTGATPTGAQWFLSYEIEGFTSKELYYFANSFKKSFFKLDLYDTLNSKSQTNYITLILPPQQGTKVPSVVGYNTQQVASPKMKLDSQGNNKEGYFIYWLKNRTFLNIDTFYMTAKFFDAKKGVFMKMMNRPQSIFTGLNKFNFPQETYFYYKVVLDYNTFTYKIFDVITGQRVGDEQSPINWYEYMNPNA